jgi:1,4-dihydroxy-2-naphthoyl-CoA hydrolase
MRLRMFTYETSVKLHDTDAAGLLFFAHQFTLAHDAYELFMESIGESFHKIINHSDYLLAIVHAEADFKKPLFSGDRLIINLTPQHLGNTSFTLIYDLRNTDGVSVGTVRTVHVCIDKQTRKKKPLPEDLRKALLGRHQ